MGVNFNFWFFIWFLYLIRIGLDDLDMMEVKGLVWLKVVYYDGSDVG